MTEEQLNEIKARRAAATQGEWRVGNNGQVLDVVHWDGMVICSGLMTPDAAFIANAPFDIDALIVAYEAAQAEVIQLQITLRKEINSPERHRYKAPTDLDTD